MVTKRRTTLTDQDQGLERTYNSSGSVTQTLVINCLSTSLQETVSFGHPFKHRGKTRFKDGRDCGGPFRTFKCEVKHQKAQVHATTKTTPGTSWRQYDGPIYAYHRNTSFTRGDFVNPSSDSTLDAIGSTAIANSIPTNPVVSLGTMLGELRELPQPSKVAEWLPTVAKALLHPGRRFKDLKSARKFGQDAADDYLNFQFGWAPFAKEFKQFFDSILDVEKNLNQYTRDAGRLVRRRFNFRDITSTTVEVLDASQSRGSPILATQLYESPGILTKTTTVQIRRWFSGGFTYYLPRQKLQFYLRAYAKLYGLDITPELVWSIAPWAWATDWIGNFGKVVRNVSAFARDGLVMRYGYICERTTVTVEYSLVGLKLKGRPDPINATETIVYTTKVRRRATPYGFGLNPNSFTNRQWSIIAALGISRSPRSLDW